MKKPATIVSAVLIVVISLLTIGAATVWAEKARVEPEPSARSSATFTAPKAAGAAAIKPAATKKNSQAKGSGLAAIERTAKAGKYLFVFLYKEDNEQTRTMRKAFDTETRKIQNKVRTAVVNIADPAERGMVERLKLAGAPTPLVMVLAPNGAITGAFMTQLDAAQVPDVFVSPCTEKCLKALQDGKVVFLCVQNVTSTSSVEAMRGVAEFKADSRFSPTTEVITLNPADAKETSFLSKLQIDPKAGQAVTVLMAPPGGVVSKFAGATDKNSLMAALNSRSSGCCASGSKSSCGTK